MVVYLVIIARGKYGDCLQPFGKRKTHGFWLSRIKELHDLEGGLTFLRIQSCDKTKKRDHSSGLHNVRVKRVTRLWCSSIFRFRIGADCSSLENKLQRFQRSSNKRMHVTIVSLSGWEIRSPFRCLHLLLLFAIFAATLPIHIDVQRECRNSITRAYHLDCRSRNVDENSSLRQRHERMNQKEGVLTYDVFFVTLWLDFSSASLVDCYLNFLSIVSLVRCQEEWLSLELRRNLKKPGMRRSLFRFVDPDSRDSLKSSAL